MKPRRIKKSESVIMLIMLQVIFVIILFNVIISDSSFVKMKYSSIVFNIIILISTIGIVHGLQNIIKYCKEENQDNITNKYLDNVDELVNLVNDQRVNHYSHMQNILTLLHVKKSSEAENYVKDLLGDYTQEVMHRDIGQADLSAVINAKKVIARENRVRLYVRGKIKNNAFDIRPKDLAKILDSILNNSIEAARCYGENSWANIIVRDDNDNLYFKIINRGKICEDSIGRIYDLGYSTSAALGKGYGLYIVKRIIDGYDGIISINNGNNDTVITEITIPRKKVCSIPSLHVL